MIESEVYFSNWYRTECQITSINNIQMPYILHGVMIETLYGPVAVEDLTVGDNIIVADGQGYQPIRWIGVQRYSGKGNSLTKKLIPVRIVAGSLGGGLPKHDLLVSQEQHILLGALPVRRGSDVTEALVAARHLLKIPGVELATDLNEIEVYHILFDNHEIIFAEEIATESIYLGKRMLKKLPRWQRIKIHQMFPELVSIRTESPLFMKASRPSMIGMNMQSFIANQIESGRGIAVKFP